MVNRIFAEKTLYSFKPSTDYYQTQQRFQEILEEKLNIKPTDINIMDIPSISTEQIFNSNYIKKVDRNYEIDFSTNKSFDPGNVKGVSNVSGEFIDMKLKGTAMEGLGESFKKAEKKYGINALFLASLAAHESALGTSRIAKDKNNLFGFGAYDRSPYESAKKFATKEAGIMHVAEYLSKHYLNSGGKYFNGYKIEDIGKKYATDPNWAKAIKARMSNIFGK